MRRRGALVLVLLATLVALLLVLPELVSCTGDSELASDSGPAQEAEEDDDWEDFEDDDDSFAGSSKPVKFAQKALPQLNDQNAERILSSTEYVFVLGYASWCKQSAAVMVHFAEAAAVLAAKGSRVALAKLDAVANQATANRYQIKGFPSIIFFTNGSAEIYSAGQTREDFVNWVQKRTGQAGTTFMTSVEAEELRSRNHTVVVGLFEKFEGPEYEEFMTASVETKDIEFLLTTNAEAAKVFSVDLGNVAPAVGIWKSEPENFVRYAGGQLKSTDVVAFAHLNKHPLVMKLDAQNVGKVYTSPTKKQLILFANREDYESIYPIYLATAKDFKGKLIFLWVDVLDEDFSRPMMTVYGISESEPVVGGFDNNNGSRYLLESEVTIENLKAFATDFYEGRLKIHYKSEHIPKKNKGDVKVIVGKTFEKLVLNSSKDMLLLVYTPYCYDCDSIGKVFVKLAKHFKGVSSIVFGKVDAASNEHPELQVNIYPSILFYQASNKSSPPVYAPVKPTLKKLVQFVEENHVKLLSTAMKEDSCSEDAKSKGTESTSNPIDAEPEIFVLEESKKVEGSESTQAVNFELSATEQDSETEVKLSKVVEEVEALNIRNEPDVTLEFSRETEVPVNRDIESESIVREVELPQGSKTESKPSTVKEALQEVQSSELPSHDEL